MGDSAHAKTTMAEGPLRSDPGLRRFSDIRELIGNPEYPTPLVRLQRVVPAATELYLKLEGFNPFGSSRTERPSTCSGGWRSGAN